MNEISLEATPYPGDRVFINDDGLNNVKFGNKVLCCLEFVKRILI